MGMKLQRKRNLSAIYAPYIQNSELILILKLVSSRYIKLFKLLCFFFEEYFWRKLDCQVGNYYMTLITLLFLQLITTWIFQTYI